jgi:hypothetical protein
MPDMKSGNCTIPLHNSPQLAAVVSFFLAREAYNVTNERTVSDFSKLFGE